MGNRCADWLAGQGAMLRECLPVLSELRAAFHYYTHFLSIVLALAEWPAPGEIFQERNKGSAGTRCVRGPKDPHAGDVSFVFVVSGLHVMRVMAI